MVNLQNLKETIKKGLKIRPSRRPPVDVAYQKYRYASKTTILDYVIIGMFAIILVLPTAISTYAPFLAEYTGMIVFGAYFASILILIGGTEIYKLQKTRARYFIKARINMPSYPTMETQFEIQPSKEGVLYEVPINIDKKGFLEFKAVKKTHLDVDDKITVEEDESAETIKGKYRAYFLKDTTQNVRMVWLMPFEFFKGIAFEKGKVTIAGEDVDGLVAHVTLDFRRRMPYKDFEQEIDEDGKVKDVKKAEQIIDIFEVVDSPWHRKYRMNRTITDRESREVMIEFDKLIASKYIDTIEFLYNKNTELQEKLDENQVSTVALASEMATQESQAKDMVLLSSLKDLDRRKREEKIEDMVIGGIIATGIIFLLMNLGVL